MHFNRRMFLTSSFALIAGCTSDVDDDDQYTSKSPGTETKESNTMANTRDSNIFNPDETLRYGESYVDTGLELTVDTPTINTTFSHDGTAYEMPDGEILVFTPITFYSTLSNEFLPIDGPIFSLLGRETEVLETHRVNHPSFDPSVRVEMLDGLVTTQRWTAEGGALEPGQRIEGTAVFHVSETIERLEFEIVYESDRIRDDRFGDEIVSWTNGQ